ncbi:MAG: vWA domain-containing protein [Terracidiphilus sp.]
MNRTLSRQIRKLLRSQRGQSVVMVAITVTAILTMAVSSAEVGHVYYAYRQLVSSTNAATLAGAQAMSDALFSTSSSGAYTAEVTGAVKQYSSESGQLNASNFLTNDTIATQTLYCSSTMSMAPFYVVCQTPPGGSTGYNAITVTQTAKVNLWFGGLIGMTSMNLSATASAAMKGGSDLPYNLAVIMDTTASMQTTIPGDKDCTTSQISCAVQGLEVMLQNMDPCAQNTTCSTGTPYVDDVALFVFPAPSTAFSANEYKSQYCGLGATSVPYNFVNVTPGTNQNLAMKSTGTDAGAYEIIPFSDTYKTNDTSNLAVASALAEAVGYGGSGCTGLSAPGGQGTYYAQVIYTAQAALLQQQETANNGSQNVMIILSDGDATACASGANTAAGGCNSASNIVAENNPNCGSTGGSCLNGTGTKTTNPSGYQSPNYPSALGECGQAVQAAQLATAAGTQVYTIGFGSETSGCTSDETYTTTAGSTDGAEAWPSGPYPRTPCNAIAAMASNVNTFYSDNSGGCPALTPANADFTSLADIFQAILTGLGKPRIIPNGTT